MEPVDNRPVRDEVSGQNVPPSRRVLSPRGQRCGGAGVFSSGKPGVMGSGRRTCTVGVLRTRLSWLVWVLQVGRLPSDAECSMAPPMAAPMGLNPQSEIWPLCKSAVQADAARRLLSTVSLVALRFSLFTSTRIVHVASASIY